jgi:cyclic pyranopterin phosphate synthase
MSAKMIDIGKKKSTGRTASARGELVLQKGTLDTIRKGAVKKGDVLTVAQTAGIQAAKNTWGLLPLCHQIPLHYVAISFRLEKDRLVAACDVGADYKTGVEMDALVGVTVALLTVWDMVKYLEKDGEGQYPSVAITGVRVVKKTKREKR